MEYIYLNPAASVTELRDGCRNYIEYYNNRRHHQSLGGKVPWEVFHAAS